MKELLRNFWLAPGASMAGALCAAIAFVTASGIDMPQWVLVVLGALGALLGVLSGPSKAAPPRGRLPLLVALAPLFLLISCGTVGESGSATPGWWKPSTQVDPRAQFGVLLHLRPEVNEGK